MITNNQIKKRQWDKLEKKKNCGCHISWGGVGQSAERLYESCATSLIEFTEPAISKSGFVCYYIRWISILFHQHQASYSYSHKHSQQWVVDHNHSTLVIARWKSKPCSGVCGSGCCFSTHSFPTIDTSVTSQLLWPLGFHRPRTQVFQTLRLETSCVYGDWALICVFPVGMSIWSGMEVLYGLCLLFSTPHSQVVTAQC